MATKIILAFSLIGFWLFLPVPFMLMQVGGFEEINMADVQTVEKPKLITAILDIGSYFSIYFKMLFFIVPSVNPIIGRFVNFLQIMSGLFIFIMVRGN